MQVLNSIRGLFAGRRKNQVAFEYRCGQLDIVLPPGHRLRDYQLKHPWYDRFLPCLATFLPQGSSVIDVGANVGDTLAAMVSAEGGARTYVCIEPDPEFFAILQTNAERVSRRFPGVSVICEKALVGREVAQATLSGGSGTKHAVPGAGGTSSMPLDQIASKHALDSVALLKSDVDGFDYDVIASAETLIKAQSPLLFFECDTRSPDQLEGFKAQLRKLTVFGYCEWAVFDNFGQLMLLSAETEAAIQLIEYAWRQSNAPATRTIFYLDILAATKLHSTALRQAITEYRDGNPVGARIPARQA